MDEFWSKLLQEVAVQVVPVLAVFAVGYAVKAFGSFWADLKFSQPDRADALEMAAKLAVKAAEQAGASQYIYNKKEYALDVAENWLAMRGIHIDLDLIDAAVEAAVFEQFNADKEKPKAAAGFITDDAMDRAIGGTPVE